MYMLLACTFWHLKCCRSGVKCRLFFFFKDLGHSVGSHFNSSSSMTIDVPINDMNHSLLTHSQLTTIDHSDLSAHLGLSLGGVASVSKSPDQPLSTTPSPAGSLQDEDMEDFRQVSL